MSGKDWVITIGVLLGILLCVTIIWPRLEKFTPEVDYRVPYNSRNNEVFVLIGPFNPHCFLAPDLPSEEYGDASHPLRDGLLILKKMVFPVFSDPRCPVIMIMFCAVIWVYQAISESDWKRIFQLTPVKVGVMLSLMLYMIFFTRSSGAAFIYFQF